MAKKSKKKKETTENKNEKVIAENRKARHDYEILDHLECGIQLTGSEVKSLRDGKLVLSEAFAQVVGGEVFLINSEISPYSNSSEYLNHEARRKRKLLLHKREIAKFASKADEKGLTLVPLKMYFKQGRAKVLLGIGRGRQMHDKREKLKKDSAKRDIDRAMKRG